jgi:uncharacterized protein YidB (DUF937 family)
MSSVTGDSGAVPGGNLGKPLMIALLALLAAKYFGGGKDKAAPADAPQIPPPARDAAPEADAGNILGGLGGLNEQFQTKGFGDRIDTWIGTGKNKDASSGDVTAALGTDVIDELARRTGLSRDQVVNELARVLPKSIDRLTPDGRMPTRSEMQQLMG